MDYATNPQAVNLERLKARLGRRGKNDPLQPLPLGTASNENWASSMDSCLSWLQRLPDLKETQKPQLETTRSIDVLSMDSLTIVRNMLLDGTESITETIDFDRVHDRNTTDVVCASSASNNGPSQTGDRGKRGTKRKYITDEINSRDVLCCQEEDVANSKIDDDAWYYDILERNRSSFDNATLAEKRTIALKVAKEVVSERGRFLKKDKNVNQWYLAGKRAVVVKLSEDLQTKIYITDEITSLHVLFGQGGESNNHEGNKKYREIVDKHRPDYESASRKEKAATTQEVINEIKSEVGSFLRKDRRVDQWFVAGDIAVWDKVTQALRDKNTTPEARLDKRTCYPKKESKKKTKVV